MGDIIKRDVEKREEDLIEKSLEIQKFMNRNVGELVVTVNSKKVLEGNYKTAKDGSPILDDNGEPQRYDDTFYVSLSGAVSIEVKVSEEQFRDLEEEESYLMIYKLDVFERSAISKNGNGYVQKILNIKPLSFRPIKEVLKEKFM